MLYTYYALDSTFIKVTGVVSISAFGLFISLLRLLLIGGAFRLLIGQSAVSFLLAGHIVFTHSEY